MSGLSISPGELAPAFNPYHTDYMAVVEAERITLTATRDSGTTLRFLDEDDVAVPDADGAVDGHQVDLEFGVNTIRIRVISGDGRVTQTYSLEVTRATVPGVPTINAVTPGGGYLAVEWSELIETGEVEVTSYDLRHIESSATDKVDGSWTVVEGVWTSATGGPLEYTVTGVDAGVEYDVQVRAVNVAGAGPWSTTVTGTPEALSVCVSGGAVGDAANTGLVSDCEALLVAKDALAGTAVLNWSADTPITGWDGIGLGGTPMRVTRLSLPNAGLDGTIPAELGMLPMLTDLNLRTNALSGQMPGELGHLTNLVRLNLHTNQLSGPIPDLSRLVGLEEMYLARNMLTGPVPAWLNGMTEMRELWLWGNRLTGTIPDLSGMTGLEKLKLAANNLEGGVPEASALPTNLRWLIIQENPLGGTIPDLSGMSRMTVLWLHTNGLTGELPASHLPPNLTSLNLHSNELSGEIPDLSGLDKLQWLRLQGNQLSGTIPSTLGEMESLTRLWLHGNMLSGTIPAWLGGLTKLQRLWLSDNMLSGEIPGELGELGGHSLVQWRLGGNALTGCVPAGLADVTDNDLDVLGLEVCSDSSSEPPDGSLLWSVETDSAVNSSPEMSDGAVYVGTEGGYLYALDAADGSELWRYRVGVSGSGPEVADGVVYVGSWDSHMYALDSATGNMLWRYRTEGEVDSSPAVAEGTVYFGSNDGHLYALDAETGALSWRYKTEGQVWSSPAVSAGIAYVGSTDSSVYALDASTGDLIWRYETGAYVSSSPTVSGGVVYIGSRDGYLYALDASTGHERWSFLADHWIDSPPIVVDMTAYITSFLHVYALDARTGELSWRSAIDDWFLSSLAVADEVLYVSGLGGPYTHALDASNGLRLHSYEKDGRGALEIAGGVVYIGSGAGVYAYDAVTAPPPDGPPWRFQADGEVGSPPAVVDGVAYVSSTDGHTYVLQASTGELLWRHEAGDETDPSPVAFGGVAYVVTRNGFVHALDASTGEAVWEFDAGSAITQAPIVDSGVAYIWTESETVYALEALEGDLIWQYQTYPGGDYATISFVEVDGGAVFVGSVPHSSGLSSVTALEALTGELVWRYTASGGNRAWSAAAAGPALYIGYGRGQVLAFEAASGDLLWQFAAPGSNDSRFVALSENGGSVYAASEYGDIFALNPSNGDALWQYEAGGRVYAPPTVVEGLVYIGSLPDYGRRLGYLYALEASTGREFWRHDAGDASFSFTAEADGAVYMGSEDGSASMLDASTGDLLWGYRFGYTHPRLSFLSSDRGATLPVVVDGVVYVGAEDGSVYGLDPLYQHPAANVQSSPEPEPDYPVGELLWRFKFPSVKDMSSNPTVADGMVYITLWDKSLHALDAATGSLVWSYNAGDTFRSSPAVADGVLYAGSADNHLYALDASTGDLLWSYDTSHSIYAPPVLYDGVVYVGSGTHIHALDSSTGELLWSKEIDVHVSFAPLIVAGVMYVSSSRGYLYALDAATGSTIWRFREDDDSCSLPASGVGVCDQRITAPALVDGILYVGTRYVAPRGGHIRALDALTGDELWRYEVPSLGIESTPVVYEGVVYAAGRSIGGRIHALNALSGELMWEYRPGTSGISSLAVRGRLVLAGAGGQVYALDVSTGDFRWRAAGSPIFRGSPLISQIQIVRNGVIYAGYLAQTEDQFVPGVSVLDAETGEVLWRYHTEVGLGTPATVADGVLYISSLEQNVGQYLYAITSPQTR